MTVNSSRIEQAAILQVENIEVRLNKLVADYRLAESNTLRGDMLNCCQEASEVLDSFRNQFEDMNHMVFSGKLLRTASSLIERAERCYGGRE